MERQTSLMCLSKVMSQSKTTLSSLTLSDSATEVPATSTCEIPQRDIWKTDVTQRQRLQICQSGFNATPLCANHECSDKRQFARSLIF